MDTSAIEIVGYFHEMANRNTALGDWQELQTNWQAIGDNNLWPELNEDELCTVLIGLAKFYEYTTAGDKPHAVKRKWVNENIHVWIDSFRELLGWKLVRKPSSISIALNSLKKLDITPPDDLLQLLQSNVIANMASFRPLEVANTLRLFGKNGIHLDAKLLQEAQLRTIQHRDRFEPKEIAYMLWAMGKLGIQPGSKFLNAAQQRLIACKHQLKSQDIVNTLWAVAVFDTLAPGIWDNFTPAFEPLLVGIHSNKIQDAVAFKTLALLYRNHIPSTLTQCSTPIEYTASQLETKFIQSLPTRIQSTYSIAKSVQFGGIGEIDVVLNGHQRDTATIAIQIDGPSHFTRNTDNTQQRFDGGTVLMTRALATVQPQAKILRVHYVALSNGKVTPEKIDDLLQQVAQQPEKLFVVNASGQLHGFVDVAALARFNFARQ